MTPKYEPLILKIQIPNKNDPKIGLRSRLVYTKERRVNAPAHNWLIKEATGNLCHTG